MPSSYLASNWTTAGLDQQPSTGRKKRLAPLGPFLVHDPVSTFSTTDRFTRSDLVSRATICFEERFAIDTKRTWDGVHLRRGTPFLVFEPCKERRRAGNLQPVVADS